MPTEITRAPTPIVGRSRKPEVTPEVRPLTVSPLIIAATIAFVMLHLVSGVLLERSQASPAAEPSSLAALDNEALDNEAFHNGVLDNEAKCPAEIRRPGPSLPYD
jgi:hypothetical protein